MVIKHGVGPLMTSKIRNVKTSVADPYHYDADPDTRIRFRDD